MHNEFTAIVEQDGPWYVAYCAEVPGANGQGKSREECLANLREAISLVLEHRREESLRALPADAKQELVIIG
jgi:predicted RNase H-like HicB family nuclease